MSNDFEAFRRIPILNVLSEDAITELCRSVETLRLGPGEALFRIGDLSEGAYLVVSGCMELRGADAGSTMLVYPGSLIGELSLFADLERNMEAVARDRTELRRIPRAKVRRVLEKDPASAARLRAFLDAKSGEFARTLASFKADSA